MIILIKKPVKMPDTEEIIHPVRISKQRLFIAIIVYSYPSYILPRLIKELNESYTDNYVSRIMLAYTISYFAYILIKIQFDCRILIHGIKYGFNQRISSTNELYGHNSFTNYITFKGNTLVSLIMFILSLIILDIYFRKSAYLENIDDFSVIDIIAIVFLVIIGLCILIICIYMCILYNYRNGNSEILTNTIRSFRQYRLGNSIAENIPFDMSRFEKSTNKDSICPYCTENIQNNGVRGTCNREHIFHKKCLEEHRQFCIDKNEIFRCPLCREAWTSQIV